MRERRGFSRGFDFEKPKPVKIGQEYDVTITDLSSRGDGIARIEDFIIFVAGTKKDEHCRIKIKEVAPRFAVAEKIGPAQGGQEDEQEEQKEEQEESESSDEQETGGEESGSDEEAGEDSSEEEQDDEGSYAGSGDEEE